MGNTARIAMINDTAWPQAMSLHGHDFRQIGVDGCLGALQYILLMNRGETIEIATLADSRHAA